MKVKILSHKEVGKGIKGLRVENAFTGETAGLILAGDSYNNFVKYVMYLWSNDLKSNDVVTKIVNNGKCYCFYKV